MKKRSMIGFSMVICWVCLLTLAPLAFGLGGWGDPPGGWDRIYSDFDDLAQWTHNNGSDAWDGSVQLAGAIAFV